MKKYFPLLATVILIGLFIISKKTFFNSKKVELPKYGNYLSCQGHPFDLRVKFQSHLYLDKASLPKGDDIYFSAIYFQNMYSFTNIPDYNSTQSLKWTSLGSKDPVIKILKKEDVPYPMNIELPPDMPISGFPPTATEYLEKLKAKRTINKNDRAVKVTYQYEHDLLFCFDKNKVDLTGIKIVQPVDPYTAYFVVPAGHRKLVQSPVSKHKQLINPCMNPQSVNATEFHPFHFWFFWKPFTEGHDSNKAAFNCNDYYQDKVTINTLNLEIVENKPKEIKPLAFEKFENLNRPISVSIFMGSQETIDFARFNKEEAEKYIKLYLSGIDISTARKELPYYKNKYDSKFSSLLWLIRNISEKIDIRKTDYSVGEYFAKVTLKGKMRLSHKDIIIKVFLNQTSPKFESSDYFARSFADEFLNNDIVTFGGHVSNGNVFKKSIVEYQKEMKAREDKKINYQIFALFSCTAHFFYRPESFPRIENPEFRRDVILTGGGFNDGSANSSLILIGQVDSYLHNKGYAPFAYLSKMAKADNFYILSNH